MRSRLCSTRKRHRSAEVPRFSRLRCPSSAAAPERTVGSDFDAEEEKADNGEQIPGGKVVESRYERVQRRLRRDVVGGAGDDRQAGRADELGDVRATIDETKAAGSQLRRPQLGHVRKDDRKAGVREKAGVDTRRDNLRLAGRQDRAA